MIVKEKCLEKFLRNFQWKICYSVDHQSTNIFANVSARFREWEESWRSENFAKRIVNEDEGWKDRGSRGLIYGNSVARLKARRGLLRAKRTRVVKNIGETRADLWSTISRVERGANLPPSPLCYCCTAQLIDTPSSSDYLHSKRSVARSKSSRCFPEFVKQSGSRYSR